MTQLEKFIKDNNLQFTEGQRNSDLVVLCGYGLFIGADKADICSAIPSVVRTGELGVELEKVFYYASKHHYENWWKKESNRLTYKL